MEFSLAKTELLRDALLRTASKEHSSPYGYNHYELFNMAYHTAETGTTILIISSDFTETEIVNNLILAGMGGCIRNYAEYIAGLTKEEFEEELEVTINSLRNAPIYIKTIEKEELITIDDVKDPLTDVIIDREPYRAIYILGYTELDWRDTELTFEREKWKEMLEANNAFAVLPIGALCVTI